MNNQNTPLNVIRGKKVFLTFSIGYTVLGGLYLYSFLIAHENVPLLILNLFWFFQIAALPSQNRSRYQDWALILSSIELAIVLAVQVYTGFARPVFYLFALAIALCSLAPYCMNKRKLSQKNRSENN